MVDLVTFIESKLNFFMHFHDLIFDILLDCKGKTLNLISIGDIVLVTANDAHNVETFGDSECFEETLSFFIKLRLVRILVVDSLRDDSII